jgi:Family of unknown function (DUF5317)
LRCLAHVRIRAIGFVVSAFLVQLLAVSFLNGPGSLLSGTHIMSYLIVTYALWKNRQLPGLLILTVGALSNGITILANGGTLPARATALRTAGLMDDPGFVNSGVLEQPRLAILGDIFAIPAKVPLANVFSIGDVLIVAGATWASLRICGTHWTTPWAPTREHAISTDAHRHGATQGPRATGATQRRLAAGSTVLRRSCLRIRTGRSVKGATGTSA